MRLLALATAIALSTSTACVAPRPYHRMALAADGVAFAAAVGAVMWDHHNGCNSEYCDGLNDTLETTAGLTIITTVVAAIATLVVSRPPPAPKPAAPATPGIEINLTRPSLAFVPR